MNKLLTENEMIAIIKSKTIAEQSEFNKAQVMAFAFGETFMASKFKGSKQAI